MRKKKSSRKRSISKLFAVAGILTFAVFGCGVKEKPVQEHEMLAGERVTFLTSQNQYFEEYDLMAAAMEQLYDCRVEFQVVPDSEYVSFLKLKFATTEVPDVFEFDSPAQNEQIEASDYCLDLSTEPWVSRLVNQDVTRDLYNEKIYAMPKESSSGYIAVYYNKKVLADCGVENPQPKTYQEFLNLLQTIKTEKHDVIPLYMTNEDNWTTQMFISSGYAVSLGNTAERAFGELDRNEVKWTDIPEFAEILTLYQDLLQSQYVNVNQAEAKQESAAEMLGRGKASMSLTTEMTAFEIVSKYPGCELGAFVIPYADKEILPVSQSVSALFVPKDGAQTDTAKAFLNAWSLPEIQNIYFFRQGAFPAFEDTQSRGVLDCVRQLKEKYVDTNRFVYPMHDQLSEHSNILDEFWQGYRLAEAENQSSQTILENFQQTYESYLKNKGEENVSADKKD